MWLRRAVSVVLTAYLGGFLASLIWQAGEAEGIDFRLGQPFGIALFALFFTIPGVIMVSAAYSELRLRHSVRVAYTLAVLCGGLIGGLMLGVVAPMLEAFAFGAFFGFVTASVWAGYNRYISTSF